MFLIVEAGHFGPERYQFRTAADAVAWLVVMVQARVNMPTATVWKRERRAWVPAFIWLHGGRA